MPLHSTMIACLSLFLLAFVILSFLTTFTFLFDFVINFCKSSFFVVVGIFFAFYLSTFDVPLLPYFIHNVLWGACNFLAFLAHLSYSDDSPVFLSTRVY
jgi:hypothetical protein